MTPFLELIPAATSDDPSARVIDYDARGTGITGHGFDLDEVDGSSGTIVREVDLREPSRLDADLERSAGADGSSVDKNATVLLVEVLLMVVAGKNQELALTVILD